MSCGPLWGGGDYHLTVMEKTKQEKVSLSSGMRKSHFHEMTNLIFLYFESDSPSFCLNKNENIQINKRESYP